MKVIFKKGNNVPYSQDFGFSINVPAEIKFNVELFDKVGKEFIWKLTANGYGNPTPNYGNGAIFIRTKS